MKKEIRPPQTSIKYFPFCEPSLGVNYFLLKGVIFDKYVKSFEAFSMSFTHHNCYLNNVCTPHNFKRAH